MGRDSKHFLPNMATCKNNTDNSVEAVVFGNTEMSLDVQVESPLP
jgi:hypothetical protein